MDHSFELDLAYAQVGLSGRRRDLFTGIYEEVRSELGPPATWIWLRCSPEEELRRIRQRGRAVEQGVTVEFLGALEGAIAEVMGRVDAQRIVMLDAEELDFRRPGEWLQVLRQKLGLGS